MFFFLPITSQYPEKKVSLMFCGDFNSTPEFEVYRLMLAQMATFDDIDWTDSMNFINVGGLVRFSILLWPCFYTANKWLVVWMFGNGSVFVLFYCIVLLCCSNLLSSFYLLHSIIFFIRLNILVFGDYFSLSHCFTKISKAIFTYLLHSITFFMRIMY